MVTIRGDKALETAIAARSFVNKSAKGMKSE
jgi:hypothetical protein